MDRNNNALPDDTAPMLVQFDPLSMLYSSRPAEPDEPNTATPSSADTSGSVTLEPRTVAIVAVKGDEFSVVL